MNMLIESSATATATATAAVEEKKNIIKLGKISNLVPSEENNNNTTTAATTKLMQISLHSFELLQNHSRKFHDQPISYDEIIEELCKYWNSNHKQKWFLT
jgi:hypothetical protein